jgi:hypothetical protein
MPAWPRIKNFFRIGPGPATVLDARADSVPLFDPGNPLAMARAHPTGSDSDALMMARRSVWKSIPLAGWLGVVLQVALLCAAMVFMFFAFTLASGTSWAHWIVPIYLFASSAYGLLFLWSRTRNLHAGALRKGFLACHCCASCGYSLRGLTPQPDGCTVCPECASAWKLEAMPKSPQSTPAQPANRPPMDPPSDSRSTDLPPDQATDGRPSSPYWDEINESIPLFLGAGRKSPSICPDRLIEHVGAARAAELEPFIRSLVNEMFAIPIDWKQHDLVSGTNLAIATVEAAHPQLSPKSLHALGNYCAWCWR